MKKIFNLLFAGAFMLFAVGCQDDEPAPRPAPNLEQAANAEGLTSLLDAINAVPNLSQDLLGLPAITVFAPNNQAFANAITAFEATDLNDLVMKIGGVENLETVLGFHVVPAVAFAADLNETNSFTTVSGQTLQVARSGNSVTITDATGETANVVTADVEIANGVVHVINRVLLPEIELPTEPAPNLVDAASAAGLSVLLQAVGAVEGLGETLLGLDEVTVFAPRNEAFAAALEDFGAANLVQLVSKIGGVANLDTLLGFHVVPAVAFSSDLEATNTFTTVSGQELTVNVSGSNVTVIDAAGNTANVVTPDVAIENGVVHVIDRVLLPELYFPDIVEAATAAELTVLLEAVTAANLGGALLEAEAITVFAPRNEAFVALLEELDVDDLAGLIELLGPEAVTKVLQFHVVPAVAFSFDLDEGTQTVPTLAGETLTVTRTGSNVTVTDAAGTVYNVVIADVAIENGVVHVIDGVLLPTLD